MSEVGRLLRAAERGLPLNPVQVWKLETTSLAQFRRVSPACALVYPSAFTDPTLVPQRPGIRRPFVTSAAPSADGALLALTSSDARIELHELPEIARPLCVAPVAADALSTQGAPAVQPQRADSARLSIVPSDVKARAADACWHPKNETTFMMGLSDRLQAWYFDVETCAENKPCSVLRLGDGGARGITDMTTMAERAAVYAAVYEGAVYALDSRAKKVDPQLRGGLTNMALAAADPLLFSCSQGMIRVYDVRALPVSRGLNRGQRHVVTQLQLSDVVPTHSSSPVHGRAELKGSFCFAQAVEGGARLAFQLEHGTIGMANMMTKKVVIVPEPPPEEPEEVIPQSGLFELGAREEHFRSFPWFVPRRRGLALRGACGRGWRIAAPCVGSKSFRIVPFGIARSTQEARRGVKRRIGESGAPASSCEPHVVSTPKHVACVTADEQLRRIVVGYAANGVDVYQMETGLPSGQSCFH